MLFFSIFNTSNHKNIPTIKKLNAKIFSTQLQWAVITIAKLYFFFLNSHRLSLFSFLSSLSSLSSLFSLPCLCLFLMVRRWLWSSGVIWFCWSGFYGLISWVWVICFDFSRVIWFCNLVGSWVSDRRGHRRSGEISMGHWLGVWRGSLSWLAWVFDRCGGCWNCGGWWLVANSG